MKISLILRQKDAVVLMSLLLGFSLLGGVGGFIWTQAHRPLSPKDLISCISKDTNGYVVVNPICVTNTVKALLKVYSTADVINYISSPTTPKDMITVCHAISHVIGLQTYTNAGTVEGALRQCSNSCGYGCIHGVIGAAVVKQLGNDSDDIEHADAAKLKLIGEKYCQLGGAVCHAMGHLLYMDEQNLALALSDCKGIARSADFLEACYQGVFMEDAGEETPIGPGTPLFLTKATAPVPASQDYEYPCRGLGAQMQHACFMNLAFFQASLFHKHGVSTGNAQLEIEKTACETFNGNARAQCFEGIGYNLHLTFAESLPVLNQCAGFSLESDHTACIIGSVRLITDILHFANAVQYCEAIDDRGNRTTCFNVVFQAMHQVQLDQSITSTCADAASPNDCSSSYDTYIAASSSLPDYYRGIFSN